MQFHTRRNGRYMDIEVSEGATTLELGLHDDSERDELATVLREASQEIAVNDPIAAVKEKHAALLSEVQVLREALGKIAAIQNNDWGGDYEEIEEARDIARAALGSTTDSAEEAK